MKKLIIASTLILLLLSFQMAGCGKPEDTAVSVPLAPDITLHSGYSQDELEQAVKSQGGGCDTGTAIITDNEDGTYTVACDEDVDSITATGSINIAQKKVAPEIEWSPCQFEIPEGQTVKCGYLIVPEDRSQPDGTSIRLHFAIFKSKSNSPAPDPIVYLQGGPGSSALKQMPQIMKSIFSPFLESRDVIVLDQRGTGYSEPALHCTEVTDYMYASLDKVPSSEEDSRYSLEARLQCRERLVSDGINLAAYNSAESAADLNDLRIALGYEQWNLYGISYGSRLALTAMRDYPEGIRSVVLDATFPLQNNVYIDQPANMDRAFDVFFQSCAADSNCNGVYPNLEKVFWELVDQTNKSPIAFSVKHPQTGKTYDVLMYGDNLIHLIFISMYSTGNIRFLPGIIYQIRDGKYENLPILMGAYLNTFERISYGMHYSVRCNEEVSFTTPEELSKAINSYPKFKGSIGSYTTPDYNICVLCQKWNAGEADPIENEPVYSDIPALVLAGEYDPIFSPSSSRLAAETLTNSYYYEFPGVSHGASASGAECPLNIVLDFLNDPTLEPDASCVKEMGGVNFFIFF
ncbi:MAG: alpha/beta fold hydrolase [Chloroflexota bacterium]|nr:MAG: alpha/beta fold hydrolase [Chloroflexota bacterium]